MKVIAKKNRELALINAQNTQNENRAETITLVVPEEYEDYNKKIVFITPDGNVWDVITNNEYKITNAITKYKQVDFYIWLTKEVDGESIDFRTKTRPLKFYNNEDASGEITPEEISGVTTVVNILEEEITKVDSLETELRDLITDIQNKLDNGEFDGEDGYTPQKGVDYFTEQDIEEIETDVKNDLEENVLVNYSLIAETGAKIELSINTTDYKLKAILKDKNNNIIHTSNVIDLPLETMVVNATYDNTTKKIILTLQNGTTVEFSVADLVSGLVSESQLQTILSNYYTKTEINNLLNNKVDKVQGKELSSNDFTDTLKEKLEGLENYDDTEIKADISDIQNEQTEQNTDIEKLQEENARLKATLPTTTGEGQDITLDKTAEMEFVKPPLPMGNSEQAQTTQSANLFDENYYNNDNLYSETVYKYVQTKIRGNGNLYIKAQLKSGKTAVSGLYVCLCTERNPNISGAQYKMFVANGTANADVQNFTTGTDLYFCYYPTNITVNEIFENYNLWVATSDISYVPFVPDSPSPEYPSLITNVTGDVEVKVQNKNLFDYNYVKEYSNTIFNSYRFIEIKGIKASTWYTIYNYGNLEGFNNVYFADDTKYEAIRFGTLLNNRTSRDVQVSEAGKLYLCCYAGTWTETVWNTFIDNFKNAILIQGRNVESNNIPHQEQTFTFPLGDEKLMLGDYLADDGIHHVRGQVVLDGTENWLAYTTGNTENYNCFTIRLETPFKKSNNQYLLINAFSNYFKEVAWIYIYNSSLKQDKPAFGFTIDNNKYVYIKVKNTILTAQDLKTWLAQKYADNSPVIIEYPLNEEVIVPYTSAQQTAYNQIKQAISYNEQTNILSNTIALFSVEAYQNTKLVLKEMATAIVALGGV